MRRPQSPAQIAASRRNGARSRGPKTEVTRAKSARKGVTHGLFRRRSIPQSPYVDFKVSFTQITPQDLPFRFVEHCRRSCRVGLIPTSLR